MFDGSMFVFYLRKNILETRWTNDLVFYGHSHYACWNDEKPLHETANNKTMHRVVKCFRISIARQQMVYINTVYSVFNGRGRI